MVYLMLFLTVFSPSRSIAYSFGSKKTLSASKFDSPIWFVEYIGGRFVNRPCDLSHYFMLLNLFIFEEKAYQLPDERNVEIIVGNCQNFAVKICFYLAERKAD